MTNADDHILDVIGRAVDTAENFMEYGTHATTPAMARLRYACPCRVCQAWYKMALNRLRPRGWR